jgi:hypothetical protein
VLAVLCVGFAVLTLVAYLAVLFTGRYPRAIYAYNLGVLRWNWRVNYYRHQALGTDPTSAAYECPPRARRTSGRTPRQATTAPPVSVA